MDVTPCLVRTPRPGGGELIRLGHPLLDAYLEQIAARARWNTVLATAFDLKVFFFVIDKEPADVDAADVLAFIKLQREPALGRRSFGSRTARAACRRARSSAGSPRSRAL